MEQYPQTGATDNYLEGEVDARVAILSPVQEATPLSPEIEKEVPAVVLAARRVLQNLREEQAAADYERIQRVKKATRSHLED